MSGVLALLDRTGDAASDDAVVEAFDAGLAQLAHRGPDGTERVLDGPAALGHQHHATTPEATVATPPLRRHGLVAAGDVRLDNRAELREALAVERPSRVVTDHDLVCRAYDRWGPGCAERLRGAFAIVLWDPEGRRLYCARDHLGVKPLYVADRGDRFVAASEPGPLLDQFDVSARPDERRLGDYLVGHYGDPDATFYDAVDRVPPGHWLVADADGVGRARYWSPEDVDPDALAGVTDYERRFRELFEDAVAVRLRSVDPPGSLLSGGIDSSSIASVAGEQLAAAGEAPLRTFSAAFDVVEACDETEYVDAVLDAGRFEPHRIAGDDLDPLADLDAHLDRRRAPYYPALFFLVWGLYRAVGASDATVVLHGYGGDQTMGSDPRGYLRGLARRGRLRTLWREVTAYGRRYGLEPRDVLWRDVLRPSLPRAVRGAWHDWRGVDYLDRTMVSVDRAFAARSGLLDRLASDARRPAARSQRELRRRAVLPGEPTFNLELNDVAGAHFGVEPRYPYFDVRLVAFSLALPPGQTVADGLDRTIVRDALAGTLPRAVRERDDKTEFSPNVVHCTRAYALERVERTLFDGERHCDRYLDADGLRASREALQRDGDVGAARELLLATSLETWLRDHATTGGRLSSS